MAVYVDDMNAPFKSMIMCHMMADTKEELLQMVDKIGVKRKWIQHEDTYSEHFDICLSKKALAIQHGAKQVTWRWIGEFTMARRAREEEAEVLMDKIIEEHKDELDNSFKMLMAFGTSIQESTE